MLVANGNTNNGNYQSVDVAYDVNTKLLTGLEIDRDYEIKVACYNTMGQGPFSQPLVVYVGEAGRFVTSHAHSLEHSVDFLLGTLLVCYWCFSTL